MATEWRNNGEPVNGFYEAVIDLEDGSNPQVFKGRSEREVADKLLDAQTHATRRINQLRMEQKPDAPKAAPAATPLTAGERMQLAADITDPAKSDAAVERILAAKGIPVGEMQVMLAERRERLAAEAAVAETQKFVDATPDWYPSAFNKMALANHMTAHGMAFTARNFTIAYEQLAGAGLLQPKPEGETTTSEPEPRQERISPSSGRPRTTLSTGIRSGEGRSASPPQQRPKYTKRDLERMDTEVYKHKLLHEPGFAALADAAR